MKIELESVNTDNMILSAVEKYKSEVIGILFGRENSKYYKIEMVLPLATVEIKFTTVEYNLNSVQN